MLSVLSIKNAKAKERPYKLSDGLGLYLFVSKTGSKLWRMKYRFSGKEKLLSFGAWPDVSLVVAREHRDSARKQVSQGIDPGEARRINKFTTKLSNENNFEFVAREWHKKFTSTWSSDYAKTIIDRLELNIFPWIGQRPAGAIKAPELLSILRQIESRGAIETAHRIKTICSQIFRYAIVTDRAERDPTQDLRGAIPPAEKKHYAALTEPKAFAGLLRAIDGYAGSFVVKCALQLAPLLFVRPGELRHGEWPEFNFNTRLWTIPAEKMKMTRDHIVPLSKQAISILVSLKPLTGHGRYVLPCHKSTLRPMSENAVRAALRSMGFSNEEMTGHGFRAIARTLLDEVLHFRPDIIEHQLAHKVRDPNGRAYNRTAHIEERKKMMQAWADYIDELRSGAKIISITRKRQA